MAEAITEGNDIGLWVLWPANIPYTGKKREYWLNIKQVLSDIVVKSHF